MINKFELFGIFFCVGTMAVALFILRLNGSDSLLASVSNESQVASVVNTSKEAELKNKLTESFNINGTMDTMMQDDVVLGEGREVVVGDTVSVHYVGTLQDGTEFDNSNKRGEPFTFTVGEGRVIKGWEEGLVGMKVGGSRILVIPPSMAYGARPVGPIPANSTLVFSIQLISIK